MRPQIHYSTTKIKCGTILNQSSYHHPSLNPSFHLIYLIYDVNIVKTNKTT